MCLPEKYKYKYLKLVPLNATIAVFLSPSFFIIALLGAILNILFYSFSPSPEVLIAQTHRVSVYVGHVYVCFKHMKVKCFTPQEQMVPLRAALSLLRVSELEWSFEDNNV